MKKLCLIAGCIALLTSCLKYELPSEPKLSGTWRIDKITYHRVEEKDTIETLTYHTGELYTAANDSTPLQNVKVGFTYFAMDYASVYFTPKAAYGGGVDYQDIYFHTVSEVNKVHPGYLKFQTEKTQCVWKILQSETEGLIIQTRGQWRQESIGFYGLQTATNYDIITMKLTRIGP